MANISIKHKIIFLAFVGILGMTVIVGTNKYAESSKDAALNIFDKSNYIVTAILNEMLIEGQFITSKNQNLLEEHATVQKEIQGLASEIEALSNNSRVDEYAKEISIKIQNNSFLFQNVGQNIAAINIAKEEIIKNIQSMYSILTQTVEAINQEEADLAMEGEFLDSTKGNIRFEFKDFMIFWGEKQVNIQNLFLLADAEQYNLVKQTIDEKIALKITNIKPVLSFINSDELNKQWSQIESFLEKIPSLEKEVVDLWEKNNILLNQLSVAAIEMKGLGKKISHEINQDVKSQSSQATIITLFVSIVGISVLLIFSYIIIKAIVAPLDKTVAMLKDIAEGEGDLTKRLEAGGKDEIGSLANWFNSFIDQIQKIISDVLKNSVQLNEASTHLTQLSEQMKSGADMASEKTDSVASSGEIVNSTMMSVAAASEQSFSNLNTMVSAVEEMSATIQEIAKNSETASNISMDAVGQSQVLSTKVEKLRESATEINQVTSTINDISKQTNLLALNATIEAARAGEAGKGFAVVANEIKALANQTNEATDEIRKQIDGIQTSTNSTFDDIKRIEKVIDDVSSIITTIASAVEEQSITTREISNSISDTSNEISEVNESVGSTSQLTEEMSRQILEVNESSNETSLNSSEVNKSAKQLEQLANQLYSMAKKFKI